MPEEKKKGNMVNFIISGWGHSTLQRSKETILLFYRT